MAVNKNFIVDTGIEVGASANVVTFLNVGGNTAVGGKLTVNGIAVFANDIQITGNLIVTGTTTYVNTATLNIADNIITLNSDVTGTPSENAGLEIKRGTSPNTAFIWNETVDNFQVTLDGSTYGNVHSTLSDIILGTHTSGNYLNNISSGTTAITVSGTPGEGWAATVAVRSANTSVDGIVKLTDEVTNTSVSIAASATAVKAAYDAAINANTNATSAYTNAVAVAANATALTNGTLNTARLPAVVNVSTVINVGANVNLSTSSINVGNSTVNVAITSTGITGNANAVFNVANVANTYATSIIQCGVVSSFVALTPGSVVISNGSVSSSISHTSYTGTSNNSTYLNGQLASYYLSLTNQTGTLAYAAVPANIVNTTADFTITGIRQFNANVSIGSGKHFFLSSTSALSANNTFGSGGQVLKTSGTTVYWDTDLQGVTSVASGNGITGGTITTTGTLTAVGANGILVTTAGINAKAADATISVTASGISVPSGTVTAFNSSLLNGFDSDHFKNAGNLNAGVIPYARIGSNVVNTTSNFTMSGNLALTNASTISSPVGTSYVGYRNIPMRYSGASSVLSAADVGMCIYNDTSTSTITYTISAGAFSPGDAISIANGNTGIITIARSGVVMSIAGTTTDANANVAAGGLATILCVATNRFMISGAGVS